jgi:hypothetical protein
MIEPTTSMKPNSGPEDNISLISRPPIAGLTPSNSRASVQRSSHSKLLNALISACGLLAWLSLTVLSTGSLALPGFSAITQASTQWRPQETLGTGIGSSHASSYMSGELPYITKPLQCDSAGTSSIGATLLIPPNEVVCGDALVVGANATIQGEIRGSLRVIGGNASISGSVTQDVTVIGGDISVQPGGGIYGSAHAIGGSVNTAPSAIVNNIGNDIQEPRDLTRTPGFNMTIDIGSFWLSLLFWISAALGLSALAPEMIGHVRFTISHHLALSGIVGALLALASVIASIALVFTCLGIPLALAIIVAGWFAWVVGTVGLGAWLGEALLGRSGSSHSSSLIVSAILGVVILSLLKILPVAGPIIGLVTGAIALGAATLSLLSARRASFARHR